MLRDDLQDLIDKEPFEPFRIKLVNGDAHDVFHPQNVAVLTTTVNITPPDQNWVLFPIDKIASVESLIADYPGQAAEQLGT